MTGTIGNSDSLPAVHHFARLIGFLFTKKKFSAGEGLSSSELYFQYMSLPLYRRIPRCCSKIYTSSMVFTLMPKARLPLCLFQKKESFLTIRQNSLNVTTCIFTSTLSSTLPSRFRPNISVTPGDWLLGSLAIT